MLFESMLLGVLFWRNLFFAIMTASGEYPRSGYLDLNWSFDIFLSKWAGLAVYDCLLCCSVGFLVGDSFVKSFELLFGSFLFRNLFLIFMMILGDKDRSKFLGLEKSFETRLFKWLALRSLKVLLSIWGSLESYDTLRSNRALDDIRFSNLDFFGFEESSETRIRRFDWEDLSLASAASADSVLLLASVTTLKSLGTSSSLSIKFPSKCELMKESNLVYEHVINISSKVLFR